MNELVRAAGERTDLKPIRVWLKTALAKFNATLPPVITELQDFLPEGCWVAGGVWSSILLSLPINDIDVWCSSFEVADKLRDRFDAIPSKYPVLSNYTPHPANDPQRLGVTLVSPTSPPIMMYDLAFFDGPDHIVDTFDFTICGIALDGKALICHPSAMADLAARRLSIHRKTTKAFQRTRKFMLRGFTLDPKDRDHVASTLMNGHHVLTALERRLRR